MIPITSRLLRIPAIASLALLLIFGTATPASAIAIYAYTGPDYDSFQNQTPPSGTYEGIAQPYVTGWFALANPLGGGLDFEDVTDAVIDFWFSDGRHVFTPENTSDPPPGPPAEDYQKFEFSTNASGEITEWSIKLYDHDWYDSNSPDGTENHQLHSSYGVDGGQWDDVDAGRYIEWDVTWPGPDPPQQGVFKEDWGMVSTDGSGWTLVPEPGTALLLAAGLAGLTAARRRRSPR